VIEETFEKPWPLDPRLAEARRFRGRPRVMSYTTLGLEVPRPADPPDYDPGEVTGESRPWLFQGGVPMWATDVLASFPDYPPGDDPYGLALNGEPDLVVPEFLR
jgi:hypothetical protein